jgi:site-specific recombinase XerD
LLARWARDVGSCGERIDRIGHEDVARFLAADLATVRPDGRAKLATAMNCLRSSVRVFFRFCREAGYLREDPARMVRRALCAPPPPRALSDDEQRRLLSVLGKARTQEDRRDAMLFELMLATGIRVGSAIALDVADVDLQRGELRLRTAKGDRPDFVFLNRMIRARLKRYLKGCGNGPLFTARGRRVSTRHVQRRFSLWIQRAGINHQASPHSLRHSFGMRVYRKSGDVLLTKEALRHRSIASTIVYARAEEGRLRQVI